MSRLFIRCFHLLLSLTILLSSSPLSVLAYRANVNSSQTEPRTAHKAILVDPATTAGEGPRAGSARSARLPAPRPQSQPTNAPDVSIVVSGIDLQLTWSADPAATSYEIYRSPTPYFTPDGSTLLASLPAGSTGYTDPGVADDPTTPDFYIVRALGGSQVVDSNEVGAIAYPLNNVGGLYSLIALPLATTSITDAASLAAAISQVGALLKWNPVTQSFRFFVPPSTGDNFRLAPGNPVFVQLNNGGPSVVTFVGDVAAVQHNLRPGGFNFISLPLQRFDLTAASDVAADIGQVQAMLAWNEATQTFRFFVPPATGDDFLVTVGAPFVIDLDEGGPAEWP